MRKKLIMLMAVCCISLSLVGCGNTSNSEETEKLDKQIADLKTENENLKNQITKKSIEESDLLTNEETAVDTVSLNDENSKTTDYINKFLSLDSATVKICEGYSGKETGLTNVSIKNNGDKNINNLIVTVYFQDESGKDISENSFQIIGGLFGGNTLKANYSWKMETDKYMKFENLSDEVDTNKNRIEISSIEFGE